MRGLRALGGALLDFPSPWWLEMEDESTRRLVLRMQFSGSLTGHDDPLAAAVHASDHYLGVARRLPWEEFIDELPPVPKRRLRVRYAWNGDEVVPADVDDGWRLES